MEHENLYLKTPVGQAMIKTLIETKFMDPMMKKIFEEKLEQAMEERFEKIYNPNGVETIKNEDKYLEPQAHIEEKVHRHLRNSIYSEDGDINELNDNFIFKTKDYQLDLDGRSFKGDRLVCYVVPNHNTNSIVRSKGKKKKK